MIRLLVVASLVLAACMGPPSARLGLPTITHYDTRVLQAFTIDTSVARQAIATWLQARADSLENALCLYGSVDSVNGHLALRVTAARRPAMAQRTPHVIYYHCERTSDYVGNWHTHWVSPPVEAPSQIDVVDFFNDTQALTMLIGFVMVEYQGDPILLNLWELQDRRRGIVPFRAP